MIITHPEKAVATLVKLKQRGVSITIDDFGTGYSSLSYLARLPIQAVKVDQRFVHGLEQNRNDETITQAIIALSHSLGLRVIAEGVETAAQFSQFVQESDHVEMFGSFDEYFPFRADRGHSVGCDFISVGHYGVFHFMKFVSLLDADRPIDIHTNIGA